jgi:hypothetical protein
MTATIAAVFVVFGFALGWRAARRNQTVTVYTVCTGRDPYYVSVDLFRDRAEAERFCEAQIPHQRRLMDGDPVLSTFQLGPSGRAVETEDAR